MTILNLRLENDRALIAVNTQAVRLKSGMVDNATKLFALPHANAVLACGGPVATGLAVYWDCCASFRSLDDLFQVFESFAATRCAQMKQEAADAGITPAPKFMCFLVGWSPRLQQVVGMNCSDLGTFTTSLARSVVSPWEGAWPARPHEWPSTSEEMIETAKLQSRLADLEWPGQPWRGDLTLAEVTQESITFRTVREFWK